MNLSYLYSPKLSSQSRKEPVDRAMNSQRTAWGWALGLVPWRSIQAANSWSLATHLWWGMSSNVNHNAEDGFVEGWKAGLIVGNSGEVVNKVGLCLSNSICSSFVLSFRFPFLFYQILGHTMTQHGSQFRIELRDSGLKILVNCCIWEVIESILDSYMIRS